MTIFNDLSQLAPAHFFRFDWECPYLEGSLHHTKHFQVPATDEWLDEERFATMYMGWNERGIFVHASIQARTEEDSVELFFDTRDAKAKIYVSKFCHHFLFSPEEGGQGCEVTRFRGDDMHPLCDPRELNISSVSKNRSYCLDITIPASCLYGYDPQTLPRMGFNYRIRRANASSQHFSVASKEFDFEHYPSLWGTLHLKAVP